MLPLADATPSANSASTIFLLRLSCSRRPFDLSEFPERYAQCCDLVDGIDRSCESSIPPLLLASEPPLPTLLLRRMSLAQLPVGASRHDRSTSKADIRRWRARRRAVGRLAYRRQRFALDALEWPSHADRKGQASRRLRPLAWPHHGRIRAVSDRRRALARNHGDSARCRPLCSAACGVRAEAAAAKLGTRGF
jgi:hypothetical protein